MVGLNLLTFFFIVLGGITKALMDLSSEGNLGWKPFWFFHKADSWKAKWKLQNGIMPIKAEKGDNWWYLGIIKPRYKERFPFSSTAFVFTTDFWHLSQGFFLKFILLGVYIYKPMFGELWYQKTLEFWMLYAIMLIPFELTYTWLKNRKKK